MKALNLIILLTLHFGLFSQTELLNSLKSAFAKYDQEKYSEAINILEKLETDNEFNEQIYYLIGDCYFQISDYNNAIQNFSYSYKLKNKFSLYRIAECYAHLNDEYNATEFLRSYLDTKDKLLKSEIRSDKDFSNIQESKAWKELWKNEFYNSFEQKLDEAKYLISTDKFADAYYILDNLIIQNKNRYRALEMRGDLSMMTGEYKKAVKDYIAASNLRKNEIPYKIKEAEALLKIEKYNKAFEIYNDITVYQPYNLDILVNKAVCEINTSEFQSANSTLTDYLIYYPNDSQAIYNFAITFEKQGDYINALIYYNKCIENDDSNPIYFISRGDIFIKTKMFENAANDYSMALDLDPRLGEVYYKRGIAKLTYNPEESCRDFEQALKLNYNKANDYIIKYCK